MASACPLRFSWELIAIGRRRDLERVGEARHERDVARSSSQLDQPLGAVPFLQSVEGRLVDAVRANQLPRVSHDVPLVCGQLARVALCPDEVDQLLANAVTAGGGDLGRLNV